MRLREDEVNKRGYGEEGERGRGYAAGAPDRIRTCDLLLRRETL